MFLWLWEAGFAIDKNRCTCIYIAFTFPATPGNVPVKMKTPSDTATQIWVHLNLAHRQVVRRFESTLKKNNLPPMAWYDALWALERHPKGLRHFELEGHCLMEQTTLSRAVKRMVKDGLVCQRAASEDRRGRILTITDAGTDMRARMWKVYGQLIIDEVEEKVPAELHAGLIDGLSHLSLQEDETSEN